MTEMQEAEYMSTNIEEILRKRLHFSNEFFQDEVREGFLVERKMKCAWAAQMEVLREIDRICGKYGIRYFADSGTLLGAVRHKGFIPWDDDIDIAMLRDDYHKFYSVIQQELPENWIFSDWSNGGDQPFGRLVNGSAYDTRAEHLLRFHGCPYVVGVDIFQLDYVPEIKEEEEAWHLLLEYLGSVIGELRKAVDGGESENADHVEEYLRAVEKWCKIKLDRNENMEMQLIKIMDQVAQLYLGTNAKELEMVIWDWKENKKYKYEREWYSESIKVPFENIMIPIPVGYEGVLKVQYGEDYMTPRQGSADHTYPFYKSQDILLAEIQKREENK